MTRWAKETYIFDPRPFYPLRVSVARYSFPSSSSGSSRISSKTSQLGQYPDVRGVKLEGLASKNGALKEGATGIGNETSQLGRYAEVADVMGNSEKGGVSEKSQLGQYPEAKGAKAVDARKGVNPGGEESQLGQYAEVKGVGREAKGGAAQIANETSQLGVYPEVRCAKEDGLTLVMAHGTGFTKESWEPTLDDLVDILQSKQGVIVKEVWSVEAPNHGGSAGLNEDVLKSGYEEVFGWEEYARVLHLFLTNAGTGLPAQADFGKARLVGVGHSMGAAAIVLTMGYNPQLKWDRVVLCDLMCMPDSFGGKARDFLVQSALRRRDTWKDREEALTSLAKGRGRWDKRVLEGYVQYGLKEVEDGVTLKCSKAQEAACYRDPLASRRAYVMLPHFLKRVQTHMLYGEEDDQLPAEVKEDILRVVGGKESLGSWARVPGAGHLVSLSRRQNNFYSCYRSPK